MSDAGCTMITVEKTSPQGFLYSNRSLQINTNLKRNPNNTSSQVRNEERRF